MFFFLRLALGNIFKNGRNTLTILIAVFISVFAMEFTYGYMDGFKLKIINEALSAIGHVKIYNAGYYNNLDFAPVEENVEWNKKSEEKILSMPGVVSVRPEINFGAMANSEYSNQETLVRALDPEAAGGQYEKLKKTVVQGNFIKKPGDLVIGIKMAALLKLKIGDSLILLTMDQYGSINAVEGRVSGFFRNYNPPEEEGLVICALPLAQKLLAMEGRVTEIMINIKDPFSAEHASADMQKALQEGVICVPWNKEQPMIKYMIESMDIAVYIMASIIVFVAGLGIINSFLMNVMSRLPEFGVLRAMGLGKSQLFMMIMAESFLEGVIGTIAGLIPAIALVYYFQINPINYEAMGDMMSSFKGLDSLIGTALTPGGVIVTAVTGILISVLASLYPAITAVSKKPVDILRVLE